MTTKPIVSIDRRLLDRVSGGEGIRRAPRDWTDEDFAIHNANYEAGVLDAERRGLSKQVQAANGRSWADYALDYKWRGYQLP